MGLWTVAPERLKSPICSLYKVPLQLLEQGAKGAISVLQKPVGVFSEMVPNLKSDSASGSMNRNTEESNEKNAKQRKTNGGLLSVPSVPFLG